MLRLACVFALLGSAACGDDSSADPDGAVSFDASVTIDTSISPDADPLRPMTLRETGLYADWDNETLAAGVLEFAPEYELWSDAATKKRWIYLPPGTQIDTTDMDYWVYPEGTKLWKEFTRDGTRVETRIMFKTGPTSSDWYMVAYAWNQAQDEAVAVIDATQDVLGTDHDIPGRSDCRQCHDRMDDRVLGFSAIQLDHDGTGVTLDSLKTANQLTNPPNGNAPYYDVPGRDQGEVDAMGYLHANCGGCHHPNSSVMDNVAVDLRLRVGMLNNVTQTPTYTTTVGVTNQLTVAGATGIVVPGMPNASALRIRMNTRNAQPQMPPLGTEDVDAAALAIIDAWINSLN